MIVDLHAHYPMQLVPDGRAATLAAITRRAGRRRRRDRARAVLVNAASRLGNHRSFASGPRVTVPKLAAGGVQVALSVLYSPFDEMDIGPPYGAPPSGDYFPRLLRQLDLVEEEIAGGHAAAAAVARTPDELDAALANGRIAMVHCVEGAFHLGPTPESVDAAVTTLAGRGVAYITIAHLFWRQTATNANAIPFLPDRVYDLLFPQPRVGLAPLGRAAVEAMVREGVLVDLCHMSTRALADTWELLDRLDPAAQVPVIATHSGYRFGSQEYMLDDAALGQIARRRGVAGLIFAQHQLNDGLRRRRVRKFEQSCEVLFRHVDEIVRVTGGFDNIGIGTDFDGFIKPTLAGLEDSGDLAKLPGALGARYGEAATAAMLGGNALRVLRAGWGRRGIECGS